MSSGLARAEDIGELPQRSDSERQASELARRLEQLQAELSESRAERGALIAQLSHELRTPMTVVLGATQLLLEGQLDADQRAALEAIHQSGKTLFSIVKDAVDYSRIECGLLSLLMHDFDVCAAIRESCEALRPVAEKKGLALWLEIDPAVPRLLRGDALRLRQIVSTVVGDTLHFTKCGSVQLEVQTQSISKEQVELRFVVTDTGLDLSEPALAEGFSPLLKPPATRRYAAPGLRLAIARGLIELMQGSIGMSGVPAGGTRLWFSVKLDRFGGDVIPPSRPASWRSPTPAPGGLPPRRVLVAEDDELNRLIVARALDAFSCETDFAGSGREALDALRRREYDLVLMDCEMPELDGFVATSEIRKLGGVTARVPIIALTANAMPGDRERCLAAGMNDYLSKPFSIGELRSKMRRYLLAEPLRIVALPRAFAASGSDVLDGASESLIPTLDLARLAEIAEPDLMLELAQIFLNDMVYRLDALSEAAHASDHAALERGAHAVRGAAANFGARRMAAIAEVLERAPKAPDSATADTILALRLEFDRVRVALEEHMPLASA